MSGSSRLGGRKEGRGCLARTDDLSTNLEANAIAANFVRRKIAEIVRDPAVAELLSPTDHPIGTKRICVDTDYYAIYNRDNVTLVDIRSAPIQEITPQGIRTTDADYNLDRIVFATGFDAMTGPILGVDFRGRGGIQLKEKWHAGPRTYLGLMTAGFPNLFMITAPGSPSVLSNMMGPSSNTSSGSRNTSGTSARPDWLPPSQRSNTRIRGWNMSTM